MINRTINLSWIWSMAQTSGAWEKLNQVKFLSQHIRKYLVLIKKVAVQKAVIGIIVVSDKSSSGKKKKAHFFLYFPEGRKKFEARICHFSYNIAVLSIGNLREGYCCFYCTSPFLLNIRKIFLEFY